MAAKKTTRKGKIDENDFEALDRLAHSITFDKLRPLTPAQRRQWEALKRSRPAKPAASAAIPTMIAVEPALLKKVDAYARKLGVSRSTLFTDAVRRHLGAA